MKKNTIINLRKASMIRLLILGLMLFLLVSGLYSQQFKGQEIPKSSFQKALRNISNMQFYGSVSIGTAMYASDVFLVHGVGVTPALNLNVKTELARHFRLGLSMHGGQSLTKMDTPEKNITRNYIGLAVEGELPIYFKETVYRPTLPYFTLHLGIGGMFSIGKFGSDEPNDQPQWTYYIPFGGALNVPIMSRLEGYVDVTMLAVPTEFDILTRSTHPLNGIGNVLLGVRYAF